MHEGFTFVRKASQLPYVIRLDGLIVKLEVHDGIPYLPPTALACRPVASTGEITLPHHDHAATPGAEDASAVRGADTSEPTPSAARGAGESDGASPLLHQEHPAPPVEPPAELPAEPKKERDLRIDASSLEHLLTPRPKNPYCKVCNRARAKQVYHRRGAFSRVTHKWGDLATADHMD